MQPAGGCLVIDIELVRQFFMTLRPMLGFYKRPSLQLSVILGSTIKTLDRTKYSGTGNRTPSYRVKGGNVSRYTIPEMKVDIHLYAVIQICL